VVLENWPVGLEVEGGGGTNEHIPLGDLISLNISF
jgi:hypothetical protein